MIGTSIIHYKVLSRLGAGGMGEVYLAQDTRLGRNVALKILPEMFAADGERISRFEREARVLASLNHPNIAVLYGFERADTRHFLVMELVEGETLAERIARRPIPVEEALRLAHQIAQGLETAHERGIVHRDLKPANIKITPDGKVKILDFGLAKAFTPPKQADVLSSPTLTAGATNAGVILGTAAYMSPEQAKGSDTDARTDIFAFGCVLFEMLVGRRSFPGDTVTEAIASVLAREPEFSALPSRSNPRIPDLLRRCLQKDPKQRWQAIGDVRVEIESILADPRGVTGVVVVEKGPLWKRAIPAVISSIVVAAITAAVMWNLRPPAEPGKIAQFSYQLPKDQDFTRVGRKVVAISHDGANMVYVANQKLYLKPLSQMEAKAIPGTDQDANSPVFSPDGQWIAFFATAEGKLKKIPQAGGASVTLADAINPFGVSWDVEDQILVGQGARGIIRIRAAGGKPETLIAAKTGESLDGPQLLPGGENLLFAVGSTELAQDARWDAAKVVVQNLKSGERKVLIEAGSAARYVPTGHLVYSIGATLFAVPFDLKNLQVTGGPVPLMEGVRRGNSDTAVAFFGFSNTGSLVWVPGGVAATIQRALVLVDRSGVKKILPLPTANYDIPRFSPDGKQIAVGIIDAKDGSNIWIYDLTGNTTMRRLTFGGKNQAPEWTPDGKRIVFRSDRDGEGLYWQAADGSGSAERLTTTTSDKYHAPLAFTPDGKTLAFYLSGGVSRGDVYTLSLDGDRKPKPLLTTPDANERRIMFSPDGRWFVYNSDEERKQGIYVQPFPPTGAKYKITTNVGDSPAWSPDGKQIIFELMRHLMVADVQTQSGFSFSEPKPLPVEIVNTQGRPYDISPDGKQFLVMQNATQGQATAEKTSPQINFELNWFEEVKQRVPTR